MKARVAYSKSPSIMRHRSARPPGVDLQTNFTLLGSTLRCRGRDGALRSFRNSRYDFPIVDRELTRGRMCDKVSSRAAASTVNVAHGRYRHAIAQLPTVLVQLVTENAVNSPAPAYDCKTWRTFLNVDSVTSRGMPGDRLLLRICIPQWEIAPIPGPGRILAPGGYFPGIENSLIPWTLINDGKLSREAIS
jgi:hypothetical protein